MIIREKLSKRAVVKEMGQKSVSQERR